MSHNSINETFFDVMSKPFVRYRKPEFMKSIALGKKLRELREQRGETQQALAKSLSLKSRQIQRYENGQVPRAEKLKILCQLYKYDFFSLLQNELVPSQLNSDEVLNADYKTDKDEIIKALWETIKSQKKTIELLEARMSELKPGKKGKPNDLFLR